MASREILIETRRFGNALKVSAMDVATQTEVTFQAPANAGREQLQRLAAAKLDYVLNKNKG